MLGFFGFTFPDTVYYQFSSLKGGLKDTSLIPGFYFLKNSYGLNLAPYTAQKQWWTPLIKRSFIDSFFAPGNYNYVMSISKDTTYTLADSVTTITKKLLGTGVQLTWVDNNGKIWQTSKGTADQTNSSFTIIENISTSFTIQPGYSDYAQSTLVTARFNCKLYDDAGNVMQLTNGKFRLIVQFQQDEY